MPKIDALTDADIKKILNNDELYIEWNKLIDLIESKYTNKRMALCR